MGARIHLVIPAHLAMSPRGRREAAVLQGAGYEVTIGGVWFDPQLAEIDRELAARLGLNFRPVLDLRPVAWTQRLLARGQGRWARWRFEKSGHFGPHLLGYGAREQLRAAHRQNGDLTIGHGEVGVWVTSELAPAGQRVGIDFEDWYSRDLPGYPHRPTAELGRLEATLLREASYRIASSEALSLALAQTAGTSRPAVATNAGPDRADSPLPREPGALRLHWFSQTIGPHRGLELLFRALPQVKSPVRISLRGACTSVNAAWLDPIIPSSWRAAVKIEPPVPPWELPHLVAGHDVGLALETRKIPSRDCCIPNKFFHYLASGLAVIATETQGLREALAPCPNAGRLVDEDSPADLAAAIDAYATDPLLLPSARAAARHAGETIWNGDRERDVILAEVQRALGSRPTRARRNLNPASARPIAGAAR